MTERDSETITITLSVDDALDAGIAMALAEYISRERFPFEKCHRIANIFLKEISKVMVGKK